MNAAAPYSPKFYRYHIDSPLGERYNRRSLPIDQATEQLCRELSIPCSHVLRQDNRHLVIHRYRSIILYLLSKAGYHHRALADYFGERNPSSITAAVHTCHYDFATDKRKEAICQELLHNFILKQWK